MTKLKFEFSINIWNFLNIDSDGDLTEMYVSDTALVLQNSDVHHVSKDRAQSSSQK